MADNVNNLERNIASGRNFFDQLAKERTLTIVVGESSWRFIKQEFSANIQDFARAVRIQIERDEAELKRLTMGL